MSSLRRLVLATLLSLALLGTRRAAAAPTHPSPDPSESSSSAGALTPTTTTSTTTQRLTSHPIWHLLLALWRPKDASTTSALSPTESDTFISPRTSSKGVAKRGYAAARNDQRALPLPSAARQIQLLPIDGDDSETHNDSSTTTTNTQQHPDPDTPQHPTLNTKQKSSSNTAQHPGPDIQQHSDPETQQHLESDTVQQPNSEVQQHSSPETQQHTATDSQPLSPPDQQHTDSDTQQHPDPDTPQHPTRNTKQKPGPSTTQHSALNTSQHIDSEIQEHLDPDTPEHPTRKTQQHSGPDTPQHQAPDTLQDPAAVSTPHHPTSNNQQKAPPQHPPLAIQQHSSNESPPHTDTQHSAPDTQQHKAPESLQHSEPDTQHATPQEDPEPAVPHHPTRNTQQQHTVPDTPQKAEQPHSPTAPLHPPRAQYHPTPHTQHHPILHIQPPTTAQAHPQATQGTQLLPGTPWRLPHSDLSVSPPHSTLHQEEGSEASPHASPPASSSDLSFDTVHEEALGGREHNESSHPYPAAERSPDEEDDPPAEPKLDDHFFLHPMPHHRDATVTGPPPGHSDALDLSTSSNRVSVDGAQDFANSTSNYSDIAAEAVEAEDLEVRYEPPIHVEERLDEDTSALHSELGKKVLQLQGSVLMESLDYSSLVPLVGQSKETLTLKDNETTVHTMLKIAQTSGGSRDTLQANVMIQSEDLGGTGDGRYTEFSHRDEILGLEAGTPGTLTAKLVQADSGGRDKKAVVIKIDSKPLDRKTVNAIDSTAEKNQLDVASRQDAADIPSTTKPIYEEISGVLKVDTSIDDVEDFDVQIKHTENSEDFISPANASHINLIDVSLHSQDPLEDLPDITESSLPSALPSSFPTDPQTPHTFRNYPSHYPPKLSFNPDTDAANTTMPASEGIDTWPQFVANFSELNNASLSLNASLIQRSHVLSLDDHYKLVLRERGSLMLQLMDPSADPCEDFYQFACGRWNGKFPIRQDKAVDNTFERLKEDLDDVLRSLLEEEPLPTDNNITVTVKTLYGGCMNTEDIEILGAEPLLVLLRELGGWPVLEGEAWNSTDYDWVRQMARLRNYNNDILISEWVAADITNSSNHIIQLDQPELGLPGREYFINPGDYQYREAYLDLMLNVAQMLGAPLSVALNDMTDVLHFETHLSRIDWSQYLNIITWHNNHTGDVVVFGLDYFKKLVSLLEYTDNRTVSNYLLWRFVKNRISNLGERYTKVKQDYIKVLFGRQSQPERWRSCVTYVSGNLGYVVGAMFVKRYFPEASKNDTDEMIALIRESFQSALRAAHWMNEETRVVAQEKVNTIVKNVGYPEYLLNDTYMDQVYAEATLCRIHQGLLIDCVRSVAGSGRNRWGDKTAVHSCARKRGEKRVHAPVFLWCWGCSLINGPLSVGGVDLINGPLSVGV
ncbi:Neprilysin-4 [Chionoecetes opilio]|uniref:Neprilysin-4 n=1 Tax=Chionoecetes opilio TaxID=41210 RepID=A0A8J4XQG7_CHIOP|nr:Neprilysin-4 [Chionoecetes opilio]